MWKIICRFKGQYWKIHNFFSSNREKKLQELVKLKKKLQIYYTLKFIASATFMTSSLSNLANNLAEGIHKIKLKYRHNNKNVRRVERNAKIVTAALNIQALKFI